MSASGIPANAEVTAAARVHIAEERGGAGASVTSGLAPAPLAGWPAGVESGVRRSVLDELAGLCAPVAFDHRWRPQARDPDDELLLETAIDGGAEAVASFKAPS